MKTKSIKSNQSSLIWWKKVPRLSHTQRWFTEYLLGGQRYTN